MSVIVRGMEMPALCQECDLYIDGACYAKGYRDYRSIMDMSKPDDCPLAEIPTPHGRLGDLDELEKQFKRAIETCLPKDPTRHMDVKNSNRCHGWTQALTAVQEAPTVIEAEGDTHEHIT